MDKINKLINDSSSFAILLTNKSLEYEVLLYSALSSALFFKDINVYQLSALPEPFKQKWSSLLVDVPNKPIPQITYIKIPSTNSEVEEIGYEKEDGVLNLHISSSESINKNNIVIDQQQAVVDVVFCFEEGVDPGIEYKEMVTIFSDEITASEKVLEIINNLEITNPAELKKISNLLLAALIVETDNFTEHFSAHTLEAGKKLLEMGGDKKLISEVLEKEKATPLTQILGRAMSRTRTNEENKTSWTFLSKEDFEKTGNTQPDTFLILQIAQKLRALMPAQPTMIMSWQSEGGVEVMIKTFDDSKEAREKILSLAQKAACPLQNDFFVMGPFKNFSEAETQTQKMLKEENF